MKYSEHNSRILEFIIHQSLLNKMFKDVLFKSASGSRKYVLLTEAFMHKIFLWVSLQDSYNIQSYCSSMNLSVFLRVLSQGFVLEHYSTLVLIKKGANLKKEGPGRKYYLLIFGKLM